MASNERPLYEHFVEPEVKFKSEDGLLILQPDVSRQQYYSVEYVHDESCGHKHETTVHSHADRQYIANQSASSELLSDRLSSDDTSFLSDLDDDKESDSDSSDSDDDDELDWKCCVNHIDFLGEGPLSGDHRRCHHHHHTRRGQRGGASSDGLDAFLSDVLEETNRKKRAEALLLAMQRKNKWPLLLNPKRRGLKSSFSRSPETALCRRCKHIFEEPQVDGSALTLSFSLCLL